MKKGVLRMLLAAILLLVMVVAEGPVAFAQEENPSDHTDHCVCGVTVENTGRHVCQVMNWQPWTGQWTDGGYYYLTEDVELGYTSIAAGSSLTICLNGYDLTGKSSGRIFDIYGTLNICDHKTEGGYVGTITGTQSGASLATVFYLRSGGIFNLYGGNMTTQNSAVQATVGVIAGTMNLYDGKIYGGVATGEGTGVGGGNLAVFGGTLNMYGGEIADGKALDSVGGNVFVNSAAGVLNVYAGTITGGEASQGKDVYSKANVSAGTSADLGDIAFSSGKGLAYVHDNTHCICGTNAKDLGDHSCVFVQWEPWTGEWTSGGHYYLTEDVTTWSLQTVNAGESLTICLNGHDITAPTNLYRMFAVAGTLNICDHASENGYSGDVVSTFGGSSSSMGHVVYVKDGGVFNLFGGNLTAQGEANQGCVVAVNSSSTCNLYAGKIYGGTVRTENDGVGGGNVAVLNTGSFYMYGGQITEGSSNQNGGNVFVNSNRATFQMFGGMITEGEAVNGGNLYVVNAAIQDAEISGGSATGNGGDLYIGGETTITDSLISGGNANRGGNVYVAGNCRIENSLLLTQNGVTGRVAYIAPGGKMTLKNSEGKDLSASGTCIWNVGILALEGNVCINEDAPNALDIMVDGRNNSGAYMEIGELTQCDAAFNVRRWENGNAETEGLLAVGAKGSDTYTVFRAAMGDYAIAYKDGELHLAQTAVVARNNKGELLSKYADIADALSDTVTQNIAYFAAKKDLTGGSLNRSVLFDLAGFAWTDVVISEGVEVMFMDSTTDDYDISDGFGTVTLSAVNQGSIAALTHIEGTGDAARSYVTVLENGSYSFHRYAMSITHVSLQPSQAALGYKAHFRGDTMVKNAVQGFGYDLWITNSAVKTCTMSGDSFADGKVISLRLKNILSDNAAVSKIGATAEIYGDVFICFKDGTVAKSAMVQTSLRSVLKQVNDSLTNYTETQIQAVQSLCETYLQYMDNWDIANILSWPICPMAVPQYTFTQTPSTDELRQKAVKAMADMLNVQWTVDRDYTYDYVNASGTVERTFAFNTGIQYAGLPYSNANSSLAQWYEFYDPATGKLHIEGDTQQMNDLVGNTCAGSVCAAWLTVCDSVSGYCGTGHMVPKYGFLPVGGYTIPEGLDSYDSCSTMQICENNGSDVMYQAYTHILPADALVSTKDVHAIMAIESAHVEYFLGRLNPYMSYIIIQDQRGGGPEGFYEAKIGDTTVHYSGRTSYKYTFYELYQLGYIPVTTAEFMGVDTYQMPKVTFSMTNPSVSTVAAGYITSNYPICVAKMVLVDEKGEETVVERVLLDKLDIGTGLARRFLLSQFQVKPGSDALATWMEDGKSYTLCYRVRVSNCEEYTVVSVPLS